MRAYHDAMRTQLLALAALSPLIAAPAPAAPPASAPPHAEGLCAANEEVLFACHAAKGLAYVCASRPFDPAASLVQYRFGRPGQIALAFPQAPAKASGVFHFSSTAYGGGGEGHLAFSNGGYDYIIYDRMIAGDWDKHGHRAHQFSSGVVVRKASKLLSNMTCHGPDDTLRGGAYQLPAEDFDYDVIPAPKG